VKKILLLLVVVTGCRKAHLGDDQTLATRNAFAAQVASEPKQTPTFGADDADATLRARRRVSGQAGSSTNPAPGSITMPTIPMGGDSSGAWQGAKAPISLEAK
jgi:hypothetical protein